MVHFSPQFHFRKRFRSFLVLGLLLLGLGNQAAHAQQVVLRLLVGLLEFELPQRLG